MQVDLELRGVHRFGELVLDGEGEMGFHALQNAVEVVGVDLGEFAVAQTRQRLGGLTGKVAQNAHDEGQFLYFDRVADFDFISDMDTRRTDSPQFGMYTFSGHDDPPSVVRRAAYFVTPRARSFTVTLTTR